MADRQALSRATEQTDSPTPGYLFNDIAKSISSSPAACADTATYLIRRLNSKQNHNVKYKCLKVMQMVSVNPMTRGQFKRALSQDVNAMSSIKECLNFRGPPDAIHGDKIYEKVRVQAKETLDAIYSDDPSSGREQQSQYGVAGGSGPGAMTGYGGTGSMAPNAYATGNSGSGPGYSSQAGVGSTMPLPGGPKRMEGIGNPMFKDPRLESDEKGIGEMTIGEVMSTAKKGFVGMIKDPLARNVATSSSAHIQSNRIGNMNNHSYGFQSSYGNNGTYSGHQPTYPTSSTQSGTWNTAPPGASELAQNTGGAWTMASNRGPNAIGSDSHRDAYSRGSTSSTTSNIVTGIATGVGGSWGASSNTASVASQSSSAAHGFTPAANNVVNIAATGSAVSDGSYEKTLITELCPPGGMRAEPPTDKLQTFAQSIPSLNPDLICPALLDALEDGQPWIIRAKALCVMSTAINVAETHKQDGGTNAYADFFFECKDEIEPLANHSRLAVREPARKVLKALGIDSAPSTTTVTTTTGAGKTATQKAAAPPPNLLDFDESPETQPPPPPTEAPPIPPKPTPPVAPSNNTTSVSDSLFGGMSVKSKAETTTPIMPELVASSDSDLLGVVKESTPIAVSTSAPKTSDSGIFGDLNVKPSTSSAPNATGKENLDNVEEPSNGSGFSFMNGEKESTTSHAIASKDSFDPLMGSSSSTNQPNNKMQQSIEAQQQAKMMMTPQMAALLQQQQQQQMLLMQMQQMQITSGNANTVNRVMMQQSPQQTSSNMNAMPRTVPVMGGVHAGGMSASFAFMDDPAKAKKDASNKKFDFVSDAMKSAR